MQAAKLLKMKRTTFVEKLKRLQIDEPGELPAAGFATSLNTVGMFRGLSSNTPQ
jgi:hypothetical protein